MCHILYNHDLLLVGAKYTMIMCIIITWFNMVL